MSDPFNPYAPPQSNIIPASHPDEVQQLASPWRRLGASLLDTLIVLVVTTPMMWFSGYFTHITEMVAKGASTRPEQVIWAFIGFCIMLALNWSHLGRGQTIGKRIMAIRIVRKNGAPAERSHIILKRILPILCFSNAPFGFIFSIVDALCIFRSQHNTAHDDIADTKVIDLRSRPAV